MFVVDRSAILRWFAEQTTTIANRDDEGGDEGDVVDALEVGVGGAAAVGP